MTQLATQTGVANPHRRRQPGESRCIGPVARRRGIPRAAAPSGEVALRVAADAHPDLVFLDVMMEGIDGYETCQRLKALDQTRDVPVIFISARDETQSLLSGFAAGGVMYITKPFHGEEVLTCAWRRT